MPISRVPGTLTDSARAVLNTLATLAPMTRPQLGAQLGMSKPTMSLAVAELVELGLVDRTGTSRNGTGRSAATWGLGPKAGCVIGVDAGTSHVEAVVSTLDNRILAEAGLSIADAPRGGDALRAARIREAIETAMERASVDRSQLRAMAIAVPTIVSPRDVGSGRRNAFVESLRQLPGEYGAAVLLENNVNCAALAELHAMEDGGRYSFVYLQVGLKIGLGIVLGGTLFRGFHGAAGEISRLPFPWSESEAPGFEGLEAYLGAESFLQRCLEGWPAAERRPETVAQVFAMAGTSAYARSCLERHGRDIGRLAAACVGILDPGLVVLGGGIGENPILQPFVSSVIEELTWKTEVVASRLGGRGTVLGVARLAADFSLRAILGEDPHPAFSMTNVLDADQPG